MGNIFRKKQRINRKLWSYYYHNMIINVIHDADGTASVWIEHTDHADIVHKFNKIRTKKQLKKCLRGISPDIESILYDCYGNIPMSDDEFDEYVKKLLPYVEDQYSDL